MNERLDIKLSLFIDVPMAKGGVGGICKSGV